MNRIIFLNDVFDAKNITPWSRYLGPYLVAQSIEDNLPDWEIVIIDYFTKIDNFFEYIKNFINEEDDNFNLRHYHPTLPVYYWSLFISDKNSNEEYATT